MRGTAQTGSRYSFYLDAHRLRRRLAVSRRSGRQAARHLHVGSFSALDRGTASGSRRRWRRRAARLHQLRSERAPARHAGPRGGRRAGRARGRARELRQGERGGSRMALSRPRRRGDARRLGGDRAAASASRRWASGRARLFRRRAARGRRRRQVEVVDTVGAGDSFMSALLSAMDRDGALGAGAPRADAQPSSTRWLALPPAPRRSPAPAKAPIRRRCAEVEAALDAKLRAARAIAVRRGAARVNPGNRSKEDRFMADPAPTPVRAAPLVAASAGLSARR